MNVSTCRSISSLRRASCTASSEHPIARACARSSAMSNAGARAPSPRVSDFRPIVIGGRMLYPARTRNKKAPRRRPAPGGGEGERYAMRNVGPRTSVQGLRGGGSAWLALPFLALLLLPTGSWALSARLTWQPSTDSRVTGYFVYVRQATMPYGVAIDAGTPRAAGDGTLSYVVSGLSDTQTYFLALTAYTATQLESGLSNELPIGTPNPCVQDLCVSKTQCSLVNLPDGPG